MPARTWFAPFACAALLLAGTDAFAEKTVWLVRPLYPGQEALVERTEKALDKLIPADGRSSEVIGLKELSAALQGKKTDELPCFSGDERCADPIDAFVASLGFDRVVLVQGGQDEAGFKFRVVSYRPGAREVSPAVATNAILEKALLGAVAKVVPVASSLEVKTTPAGATVFIDDVKVGVTPLATQVLPGERTIRLDLKLHQPVEESLIIPVRGSAKLDKTLEKVAARIAISASPAGATIAIDGLVVGKDKIDRGITPGRHSIRITAEGHTAYEQSIEVKSDEQFTLDKSLEPIGGQAPKAAVTVPKPLPPPPPPPPTPTEQTYERKSYFQAGFTYEVYTGQSLVGRRFGTDGTGRTATLLRPGRTLLGASGEYGIFGKYFGLAVFGVSYLTNPDRWGLTVGHEPGTAQEQAGTPKVTLSDSIEPIRANLVTIRALQPQFRMAAWKFQFGLQTGLEFRTGQIVELANPAIYKDGFLITDLLFSGRVNLRFYIVDGFYFQSAFHFALFLVGGQAALPDDSATVGSGGNIGFETGFGYGF